MSDKGPKLPWSENVDDDHYDAAYDYLSLHWLPKQAGPAIDALKAAPVERFLPGDLLRAAELEASPLDDAVVRRELVRALDDGYLQAVLVVNLPAGVVIADGVHRLSLAYHLAPRHKAHVKIAPSARDSFKP